MSSPRRSLLRRAGRSVTTVAFVAVVALWAVFLRPQFLGGPAQFILVSGTSMEPQMHSGDLVLVTRSSTYRVGDRVAYRIPEGDPAAGRVVIHRIVGGSAAAGFAMRGDNRATSDRWKPKPADVVGTTRLRIPAAGRVARAILTPLGLGLLAGFGVFAFIALGPDGRDPSARRPRPQRRRSRVSRRPRVRERPPIPAPPVAAPAPVPAAPARTVSQPPPPRPPMPVRPEMTVRTCLERTAANLVEAGAAARARRQQRPGEPQSAGAVLAELAAGVQHAAGRWRGRRRGSSAIVR